MAVKGAMRTSARRTLWDARMWLDSRKEFALWLSMQSLDSWLGFVSFSACCLKHMCKLARVLLFVLFKDDQNTKCCLMSFVDPIPFQRVAHI